MCMNVCVCCVRVYVCECVCVCMCSVYECVCVCVEKGGRITHCYCSLTTCKIHFRNKIQPQNALVFPVG